MVQGKQGTTNVCLSRVNSLDHLFSNKPRASNALTLPFAALDERRRVE